MEDKIKTRVYRVLRERFGFEEFRPLQYQIVKHTLDGGSRIAVLGTGAGKSLCYLLPASLLPGQTIVVAPLVSLMRDQHRRAQSAGLRSLLLGNGERLGEARRADILFTSPERLFTGRTRRLLSRLHVSHLVIDEAHCVESWGSLFRPYYGLLHDAVSLFGRERVSLYTASAGERRIAYLQKKMGLVRAGLFRSCADRPGIAWHVMRSSLPGAVLVRLLRLRRGVVLIYCATRRLCEERAAFLCRLGFRAAPYHAGMSAAVRAEAGDRFREGRIRVLCATSAFGMGVDIPNIRSVVHLDPPGTLDAYYQESGRAGRDGKGALALLLLPRGSFRRNEDDVWRFLRGQLSRLPAACVGEREFLQQLEAVGEGRYSGGVLYAALLHSGVYIREAGEAGATVRRSGSPLLQLRLARMRSMGESKKEKGRVDHFIKGASCRRRSLLSGYGHPPSVCGGCDVCGSPFSAVLAEAGGYAERLAALKRKVMRHPLHLVDRIITGARLDSGDRMLVEQLFFRSL